MGNSVSQYGDAFTNNDYLLRFAGELRIEPTDPFWDQFLTFMMKLPASMKEDEELTDKIKSLCASLSINNPTTGNFAVLLHVFIDKTETLLSSKEKSSNSTILHVHNALFIIRSITKYLVHNSKDNTIVKQFQPLLCFDQTEQHTNDDGLLETYIFRAYFAYSEPCLMLNSHVLFTADLWSMLTLSGGSDVETSSLAQQSVLIILILANHCVSPTFSNPYRDALSNLQDNLNSLYTVLCNEVKHEEITLLLYHLLHRNNAFKIFVLSRTDMELLVLPILRTIYHAADTSCHHIYMSLIILLILTEDPLFNKTIHSTVLKSVPWYTERLMTEISLGGLMILVTTRTVQYNILKMRDKYLHTNCLAALANMSSQFTNLHPYVCQRVIGLFEVLAKTHSRGCQEVCTFVGWYIIRFFFCSRPHSLGIFPKKLDRGIRISSNTSLCVSLQTFPELKFKYVEEERPEEFFIPYVWSLVIRHAPIYWNSALYKIATGEESM
ncbi:dymeclin [Diaphorina citri]|uniref:Dymeclin n=1 Tax=Diaphorina citri TaxID=121845 RepID=A0A3Q0INK9_DIACI|nr:dymeclin [Diaphorina citri]